MALVFQYGSNTLISRINAPNRLNGNAEFISVVRTINKYSFCFSVWSKNNNCAAADIMESEEAHIYGVLYNIPNNKIFRELCQSDSKCLDQIEGEGFNYKRIKIKVENLNNERIKEEVLTHVANCEKRDFTIETSFEYVDQIISGLENVNIPKEYIDYVKDKAKLNNKNLKI